MITTLIERAITFGLPQGIISWSIWGLMLLLVLGVAWQFRHFHPDWDTRRWLLFGLLFILTPAVSLFLGSNLVQTSNLPLPGLPQEAPDQVIMFASAFPWVFAAGLLGPIPAMLLAALNALLIGIFTGANLFTPLEYALMAGVFSGLVQQRFRTPLFRLLSRPTIAGLSLILFYPFIYLTTTIFVFDQAFSVRLDFALSQVANGTLAFGGPLLLAVAFAEVLAFVNSDVWYAGGRLVPSPGESSLKARLMYVLAPLFLVWLVLLMLGDWLIADSVAQQMIESRLHNTAGIVADGVPFFLETGHSLSLQIANNPTIQSEDRGEVQRALEAAVGSIPYFTQVSLWSPDRELMSVYPLVDGVPISLSQSEYRGIDMAITNKVPFQNYSIPPYEEGKIEISFIAALPVDENGQPQGVILARTNLLENPFMAPMLEHLNTLGEINGGGALVDTDGLILYHSEQVYIGSTYAGEVGLTSYQEVQTGVDGTRQIVFYQPATGYHWGVITSVPSRIVQEIAFQIAMPVLGILVLMSLASYLILRFWVDMVTGSLRQLASVTSNIAEGNLDQPLALEGEDEVGQLGRSFEQMRVSLKSQIDEINRLLSVSQGLASSLEMETVVMPVLEGILTIDASSARVALAPTAMADFEEDSPSQFGMGVSAERYSGLDNRMMALTEQQNEVIVTNPARAHLVPSDGVPPAALMAVALVHEETYLGVLWVAFDEPHQFTDEEKRFVSTVSGQAALATANARLFRSARVGRQRVEAILASTPDPVLVTDHHNRLLMTNPAAISVLDDGAKPTAGTPVNQLITNIELMEMLMSYDYETQSKEIAFSENQFFYVTVSPVMIGGQNMGRVCVLRDITHFKELDALKSEFVSTVSHDLRSPLTLMRGYATMLQMVGDLNVQQSGYVSKIVVGVESMARLVNNLLDLGRIEAGVGLRLEMVPISDVSRQVVEALKIQAVQKQLDLTLALPQQTMPLVEADQALIQQAIHNLVENAIKYTQTAGKIDITVEVNPSGVQFSVKDTGIGIAPVDQPRLFERFFRAAGRETREQRGSGLGLAIAKSIIERHGGRVWVESQLGVGSTFYFEMPLRQPRGE